MSGFYLTGMLTALRNAGCKVAESNVTNGWQSRARSSGGFPFLPLGVQWHHTASKTSPANDLSYMINGSDDAPVGNVLLDRTGTFWPVAAGAANTAGKGGPMILSRGMIPVDQGNTQSFAFEVANNGVGEPWPQVQIDAYFKGSNAINAMLGNKPSDVFTHALGAGGGWTNRKIDPATAGAVQGLWRPRSTNSSGTWHQDDIRAECLRRAQPGPPPEPDYPPAPLPPPNDPPLPPLTFGDDMDVKQEGTRVLDTRQVGGPLAANEIRKVKLNQSPDVAAAMINVTAVNPKGKGFLTVWGAGSRPDTSAVQVVASVNVSNAVIVPLATDGTIQVFSSVPTDLLVDVQATWP